VAIVDTNCDPDLVTYPIAGNDDAIRSVRMILATIANVITQARGEYEAKYGRRKTEESGEPPRNLIPRKPSRSPRVMIPQLPKARRNNREVRVSSFQFRVRTEHETDSLQLETHNSKLGTNLWKSLLQWLPSSAK